MNLLLHTARVPTAATASSNAAGYVPGNALLIPVAREWRSTTTGASWLQLDLGSSQTVAAIAITGCNFTSCTVQADNSATPTTGRGTLVAGLDRQDRRKGMLVFAAPAAVRYLRFTIAAGTPADGAAFWRGGTAYVFGASLSLPRDALYGGSGVDWITPQQRTDLGNGNVETVDTGVPRAELALQFRGREVDDVEEIRRRSRAGACWFDMGLTDRGMQWPVRNVEDVMSTRFEGFNRRTAEVRLRELA